MASLVPAHRGYEYQDLLVACRLVDMVIGALLNVYVDQKLVADDRFDDLTTVDVSGNRERIQFKHTENNNRPLTTDTFTNDNRKLRLDRVFLSMLEDYRGPGNGANTVTFRILLRDQPPSDPSLKAVLKPLERDPGPFLTSIETIRLGFDAIALWNQNNPEIGSTSRGLFTFLFDPSISLTFNDLWWACQHLVVEVSAPSMSGDLTSPDVAERLLLTRARAEVGAESFPNNNRSAVDVAAAIVSTARAARQGSVRVTAGELIRRAQLRCDFGAVSRAHPVDKILEVLRPSIVQQLVDSATEIANISGCLLIIGPPGHGKSWICNQLLEALSNEHWLIVEHYCYLGDADGEKLERVLIESVFGSLVGRIAESDPRLVTDNRPRFSADEDALIGCIRRSLEMEPDRKIALVIDGIDHITRVRVRYGDRFDPSRVLTEALASLELPKEVVVIVLSQPGSHLEPFEEIGAKTFSLPGLSERELHLLAARLNVVPDNQQRASFAEGPLLEDSDAIATFMEALAQRSAGNALYATYLCRETLRREDTFVDPAMIIWSLPPFDGTLKNYYDHLYQALGAESGWVADVIALVDFSITRAEFCEIRPDAAHRVDNALEVLRPVLIERATQGGVRVYHESFSRYLRGSFKDNTLALKALLTQIANWLESKGILDEPRAFRSLLVVLSEAEHDRRIVDLVDRSFVTAAVAAGFPITSICANLAMAVGSAARLGDWALVVRYVELVRAADAYQRERFDSTLVAFADVPASILGVDTLAARLVDDDHLVMPARAGLQMCAAVDALGGNAPWRAYMKGYLREAKSDNTSYGEASDRSVALAWLRGRLRLASVNRRIESQDHSTPVEASANVSDNIDLESEDEQALSAPIEWNRVARWIENCGLPASEVIDVAMDTHGLDSVKHLVHALRSPGDACLALAERLTCEPIADNEFDSSQFWVTEAVVHRAIPGSLYRLLRLGVDPAELAHDTIAVSREHLFDLTRKIQERSVRWENGHVGVWLDACALAAHRDQLGMNAAEALIVGDGWYRCWLRFALDLSRAEAAEPANRGSLALEALSLLTSDLNPFSGDPRSCDLYPLHGVIQESINRAMYLLNDEQWEVGLGILKRVSDSLTTTIWGEIGGPVPSNFLLSIAVDGANPNRYRIADTLVQDEIARGSAHRFYDDIAESRLVAARLALKAGNLIQAEAFWREVCIFLTAYGWRKDTTIYELLDPLPILIEADRARARARIADAQGLCQRIPLHTDGSETSHAMSHWWRLLAQADPIATVYLSVPQLLKGCNEPNRRLNGALEDVWQEWHEHVDPLLSGALRLTLDMPSDPEDVKQIERLANDVSIERHVSQELMIWLLSRADERPLVDSYRNNTKLIMKNDDVIAQLNKIAKSFELPSIGDVRDDDTSAPVHTRPSDVRARSEASIEEVGYSVNSGFPLGLPGLLRAIRAWRRRPYDARSTEWSVDRYANAIGYRLVELAADGRHDEAVSALRSLSEGAFLEQQLELLRSVADGIERHGQVRLAAVAYTLLWTSARGGGGWLNFGGKTEIDALHRASVLDRSIACTVVAEEIERVVASGRWSCGISQAVIYACAVGALTCESRPITDVAFSAWDEAFSVINSRAPRVMAADDPDHPYRAPNSNSENIASDDLEVAFALATLGALAHPGREKKRRAFLAARLLLNERAEVAALAFDIALGAISDPATLTWLIRLIELSDERSTPVRRACQNILGKLVSRNLITVRALARRLLTGDEPPLAPPSPAEPALLHGGRQLLLAPGRNNDLSPEPTGLDRLLESVAGIRLRRGEQLLPSLRVAVRERVDTCLRDEMVKQRLEDQLNAFADRARKLWPDAFLVCEQTIEDALQFVATGGRSALLMAGDPVLSPIAWEYALASSLLDDPMTPLSLEATRQPRPRLIPPPSSGDEVWVRIREHIADRSNSCITEAVERQSLLSATLGMEPAGSVPIVDGGTFNGWRWIATVERRLVKPPDSYREPDLFVKRYRVLEVRELDDRQALTMPPVAAGELKMWRVKVESEIGVRLLHTSQPLVGEDLELAIVGDGHRGLGVPDSILVPTALLIGLLNLYPSSPWNYEDKEGASLALITWRAEYDTSDHYLAWPRISGSGIVIRPDLFDRLVGLVGKYRLVLRDFVVGDVNI